MSGFVVSCVASLWTFSFLFKRSVALGKRMIAFLVAWAVFYFMWSAGIVFASEVVILRLMRVRDDAFLLFAGSSGTQFDVWNWDAHFFFLLATLPNFFIAAVLSLGIHIVRSHLCQNKISGNGI